MILSAYTKYPLSFPYSVKENQLLAIPLVLAGE